MLAIFTNTQVTLLIQLIFIPKDLNFFKDENFSTDQLAELEENHVAQYLEQQVIPYVVGWADKTMQEKAKEQLFSLEEAQMDIKNRSYADLLARDSRTPENLILNLHKFQNLLTSSQNQTTPAKPQL